jgi:hypothetical protein
MTVTEASLAMAEGWIEFLTGIVVATLTGTVFAWSRGYLAEKAKNLATKEDIDELAKQIERNAGMVPKHLEGETLVKYPKAFDEHIITTTEQLKARIDSLHAKYAERLY